MKDYIPIAQYTYEYEILVLKHLLDKAAIPHIFLNQTAISILPFHSNALGGIILKVPESYISQAKEIIEKLENTNDHLKIV